MENYNLKLTSNIIAGYLIAMGIIFFLFTCIMVYLYDDFLFAIFLLFSIPFLIWGFVARGRKFMCNNEEFEVVGCAEEVKDGYDPIKVKTPLLTLRWDNVKSYTYMAGYAGGYIIVNTLDEKTYRIKVHYLNENNILSFKTGYQLILKQFESKFGTTKDVSEQKKKQNIWVIVASVFIILYFILKFISNVI
ncbi:MAG: hypothetical protein J5848_06110 [Bacteroidales bacterium]|nr:hypothetical protein [Bacteroidales bacterium]